MSQLDKQQHKVIQYLTEAHAAEAGVLRLLQSQIAMTPRGSYRSLLDKHLEETSSHAMRLKARLTELGATGNPVTAYVSFLESVLAQTLAFYKMPFDLVRGTSGEEKVLKNAKDACATEALEIATYTTLERLAAAVGDDKTAKLAASIRSDEERMLARITHELPKLTKAVVDAEINEDPSYDATTTGAAEAIQSTARAATTTAKRTARTTRAVPGVARLEGELKGAVASSDDLAIAGYDELTADEITAKLPQLSQIDLAKIEAYERKNQDRTTIQSRIGSLRTAEPWPGYDELTVAEIRTALRDADDDRTNRVRAYERAHKNRAGVLTTAERELAAV